MWVNRYRSLPDENRSLSATPPESDGWPSKRRPSRWAKPDGPVLPLILQKTDAILPGASRGTRGWGRPMGPSRRQFLRLAASGPPGCQQDRGTPGHTYPLAKAIGYLSSVEFRMQLQSSLR